MTKKDEIEKYIKGDKCRRTCSICRINYDSGCDGEIMK